MTALYRALPGGELISMRPQPLPTAPGAEKVGPSRHFRSVSLRHRSVIRRKQSYWSFHREYSEVRRQGRLGEWPGCIGI